MRKSLSALAALCCAAFACLPAHAQDAAANKIDPADTGFMIAATALVLMMTLPGLALFYCGMVRKKNILATMAQSLVATALVSILWGLLRLQPGLFRRRRLSRRFRAHRPDGDRDRDDQSARQDYP